MRRSRVPCFSLIITFLSTVFLASTKLIRADEPAAKAAKSEWGVASVKNEKSAATAKMMSNEKFKEILEARTIELEPDVISQLSQRIEENKELSDKKDIQVAAQKLKDQPNKLTFRDVIPILTHPNGQSVASKLVKHKDPVLRFVANGLLAGSGESASADAIYGLIHDESLPELDKQLIGKWCAGIGLRAKTDTVEKIAEHMKVVSRRESKFKPGQPAPKFVAITFDGEKLTNETFAGKVIVFHFWSTTCGPCVGNMETHIRELEKYPKDKVAVIFVSIDENEKEFTKVSEKFKIPFHNVIEREGWGGELARQFEVNQLPTDLVVDLNGKIMSNSVKDIDGLLKK